MPTTLEERTDKRVAFDNLKGALLGGAYLQGSGALCRFNEDEDRYEYCVTGVIDQVCLETAWYYVHETGEFADAEGETMMVSIDRVEFMGLHMSITPFERDVLAEKCGSEVSEFDGNESIARIEALQLLNDHGFPFDHLWLSVIERFAWQTR